MKTTPKSRNTNTRRCFAFALLGIGVLLLPFESKATVYECKAKQALEWKDGTLEPEAIYGKTVFRLDDQTGDLWKAQAGRLGGLSKGQIELPIGPHNDLIFTMRSTSVNSKGEEVGTHRFILHIRNWSLDSKTLTFSQTPLSFIVYEDSPPITLTGQCVQSEGKVMPKGGVVD